MSTRDVEVRIAVGEASIAGTLVAPRTLVPGVLFVHGWGGSQEQYLARAREVAALGCVCLTFDLRGHASTRTQFSTVSRAANLDDVVAAYDHLAAQPQVDPSAIALVGSSYGGYLAAIVSAARPVRWLALRAPALYLDAGWNTPKLQLHKDHDLRAYRRRAVKAAENRALRACAAFAGDVLLVQSELDDIVPRETLASYREAFVAARSLSYRCIGGADHGLTHERDQRAYSTVLVGWLQEMVSGARGAAAVVAAEPGPARVPERPPDELRKTA